MNNKIITATVVIVIALLFAGLYFKGSGPSGVGAASGPSHFQKESFLQGLAAGARDQFSVSNSGVVSSSVAATFKGITNTTTNAATSTLSNGCYQTTATSTATPIRLVFSSIATSSATYSGTNTVGLVGWQFGSCPN